MDKQQLFWVIGFFAVTNFGTLVGVWIGSLKVASTFGEFKTILGRVVKDNDAAHTNIRETQKTMRKKDGELQAEIQSIKERLAEHGI